MAPILNRAEAAREAAPREVPPSSSDTERLIAIADAAMRLEHALQRYSVTLIETPIPLRPAVQPDGRVLVTLEAWNAWAQTRTAVEALVRLARSADPVHR